MKIESVTVRNYRSIFNETLNCDDLTALVGSNGAGKSSFLKAIDLFYEPQPRVEPEDFFANDTSSDLIVAVTYRDLSGSAQELFRPYLQGSRLIVERVFRIEDGRIVSKYHGSALRHAAFQAVREALTIKDRGKTAKQEYELLRKDSRYSMLPTWTKLADVEQALKGWEQANTGDCSRSRDDGQFFGFKEVAQGYLGRFTRYLFIPAVRDAQDDSSEGRGSVLTELMDIVVRNSLASNQAFLDLQRITDEQYKQLLDPGNRPELRSLAANMSRTLSVFAPGASVAIDWRPLGEVQIPLPQADVKLIEDGYATSANRTGHGLQRAFIVTILQHLAMAQMPSVEDNEEHRVDAEGEHEDERHGPELPDLVLAIEEPELYQHPNRQRHLAKILLRLATGRIEGVAAKTQVLYATHSPLFVGLDRIEQIRLLRKTQQISDKPKSTQIVQADLDAIATELWRADGAKGAMFTGVTLRARLQSVLTPWVNEGFFADLVVLVEGEDDRAAIIAVASVKSIDLEGRGIAVIPCGGKSSLDRPAAVFRHLGIPVYLVWDGDKGGNDNPKPEDNHRLLRLMGETPVDWPASVEDEYSCFEANLEDTLVSELGARDYEAWLAEAQVQLLISKRRHAMKNPAVVTHVLNRAHAASKQCNTLEAIIDKIVSRQMRVIAQLTAA